jgi:hypothetical protein
VQCDVLEGYAKYHLITCQKVLQLSGEQTIQEKVWQPAKLIVTNPWEVLCVDLIRPYILKGMDGTYIDFMCVTMINTATSWFEIFELPVSELGLPDIPMGPQGCKGNNARKHQQQPYFDKTSATVGTQVNRTFLLIPT